MSYGFSGKAGRGYLEKVSDSLSDAVKDHQKDPFGDYRGSTPEPRLPRRENRRQDHEPDEAGTGGFASGIGNESNIVVEQDTYDEIAQKISAAENDLRTALSEIAIQISEMCGTVYALPKALPKYEGILRSVSSSLGGFQSLGGDISREAKKYGAELSVIR